MSLSIRDLDLQGKRVFMRVDFNVPINAEGKVADDTRIRAAIPTIQLAREKGGRVILASHLGRPKGTPQPKYSLQPVIEPLSQLLGIPVTFAADCIGDEAKAKAEALQPGEVLLLENLRFYKEEEKNNPDFARSLAELAEVYVNDAFGTAHRAHASTAGITEFLTHKAAGLLMEKELTYLGKALHDPEHPFVAILGGAKVSDKIEVIDNLLKTANVMLIGGAMSYTFLKARGLEIGKSLVEDDKLDLARELEQKAKERGVKFLIPTDHLVADLSRPDLAPETVSVAETPADLAGYDIGPATVAAYTEEIAKAKTIVWNGPMGIFENPLYAEGTMAVAKAVAACDGTTIIGGGDSVAAINQAGLADKVSHVSTGGGASLEFLSGLELPGVAVLK
ncbi:MAG TPA: phosphoglycerate kinase [Acidobacteriota bacterium]|nr:phosphoglycerate kinase [Acidobacteriota bacterium]HMZ78539.1 phosphoglycerate kinase [Acidobacteriota bacterium]HNB73669.1 phosphoglycerate kinase [Acidobacteriota bacterium]HND19318.1 phosphoglycerate kinase [Acidobacteriota bacterium]HNG93886.1 phosphoglycerate kinase [Acidobacteriota bacterium]